MRETNQIRTFIAGLPVFFGLVAMAYILGSTAIRIKGYERTVTVKGLSEREYPADIVLWPVQFAEASNDLEELYGRLETHAQIIQRFLEQNGIAPSAISLSAPAITDKSAQQYGDGNRPEFRFSALQTVTVYSRKVTAVRSLSTKLSELGKQGIAFTGDNYQTQTEYLFTRLNEVKPEMIEEATKKARQVAEKFAADSRSTLGKIRRATQGQFSISPRDRNNPHIKKVRVVSTVEYYLSD